MMGGSDRSDPPQVRGSSAAATGTTSFPSGPPQNVTKDLTKPNWRATKRKTHTALVGPQTAPHKGGEAISNGPPGT